jgi:hypothetical protein
VTVGLPGGNEEHPSVGGPVPVDEPDQTVTGAHDSEVAARDAVEALTAYDGPEVVEWGVYAMEFEVSG